MNLRAFRTLFCLLALLLPAAAERRVIFPEGVKPVGPYSPGILAGDYLYVSGQGVRDKQNRVPETYEQKVRQCLDNVKEIVEAAGLTMEHVVYSQVYLEDLAGMPVVERVWQQYFPKNPPARATLAVKRMPTDTPVEINAVAVRDLARKRVLEGGANLTHDRLYIPGLEGDNAPEALNALGKLLSQNGLSFSHVVFLNVYLDPKISIESMNKDYAPRFEPGYAPARAAIRVPALPAGKSISITGVAVRGLNHRRVIRPRNMAPSPTASPCVFAGDTLFCSAKSGFIPGPNAGIYADNVELQVRQTMRNLLDGLEEAGLDFSHVVKANVYLDDLEEFPRMNRVYGSFYKAAPPTRTTVQPLPPVERRKDERDRWPMLEQISVIAVR